MSKASTRLKVAIPLCIGTAIAACLWFFRPFSSLNSPNLKVTENCGGFLIDDPQTDSLSKVPPSEQQKAKLQEKIDCYRRQINQEPKYADAYTNLGEAYRRLGDLATARQFQQKAIELNPKLPEAKLGLALIEQESGNPQAAITTIQEVIAQKETASAYFYQGITVYNQAKFKEAAASFRKAIELDSNYAEAHVNLGLALSQEGNYQEAIEEIQQAIRINPNLPAAHFNLGVALHAQGQLEPAIASYREAIRLDPKNAQAYYNLGIALTNQGKNKEAIAAYQEVIRINPDYASAYVKLGVDLTAQGKLDEAIAKLRKAVRLNPNDPEAYNNLGVALHQQKNTAKAISNWEEALKINPNYAEAHHNLGVALASQGKLEEAIATLKQARDLYKTQGKTQRADDIDRALKQIGVQ